MRTVYALEGDEGRRNRMILAIAGAIAVHEIILGLIAFFALFREPPPPADTVAAERVTIVRRTPPTPPPTPPPVPTPRVTPTPRIAVTVHQVHQARPRAAATPTQNRGGKAAPRQAVIVAARAHVLVRITPAPVHIAVAANTSAQNGRAAGQANGGTGTGGGPGSGNGGAGGAASGNGGTGDEVGMDTPLSPCGEAWFDEVRTVDNSDGSVYVEVKMRVRLRNGGWDSDLLHWYFYYPSADADPFMPAHENEEVRLQFPPRSFDVDANQKPAIALAIKHTRPNGTTELPQCPPHQG